MVSVILTDRETYKLKFTSDLQANANMNCDRFEIKRFSRGRERALRNVKKIDTIYTFIFRA